MGKSSAPEYTTTKFNSGLWGSSTSGKKGTTYTPQGWMSDTMGVVSSNINPTLQGLLSNDYSNDPNFRAYQNNFNRQMSQAYDTDVLGQLANRGLMRSSGLQSATNAFADTLANNEMNLYDQYYNRQANNLSNLLNTSNTLYNYMTGITGANQNHSNAVSNYNLQAYQAQQAANNQLWGSLASAVGSIAAAPMTGGGSVAGLAAGKLFGK